MHIKHTNHLGEHEILPASSHILIGIGPYEFHIVPMTDGAGFEITHSHNISDGITVETVDKNTIRIKPAL